MLADRPFDSVLAPAKINLYLDIVGRRDDGYHLLDTVMQSVALSDRLLFYWGDATELPAQAGARFGPVSDGKAEKLSAELPTTIPIDSGGQPGPLRLFALNQGAAALKRECRGKNIIEEAYNRFFRDFPQPFRLVGGEATGGAFTAATLALNVGLFKAIPTRAGLGGASADAAALLRFLAAAAGVALDDDKLIQTAAAIGADVPFMLRGGLAHCQGIGEQMAELPPLPTLPLLILKPLDLGISTAAAFRRYDALMTEADALASPSLGRPDSRRFLDALKRRAYDELAVCGGNVFANLIEPPFDGLAELLGTLRQDRDCLLANLSGSGSAVFALYRDNESCDRAAACWRGRALLPGGRSFELYRSQLTGHGCRMSARNCGQEGQMLAQLTNFYAFPD